MPTPLVLAARCLFPSNSSDAPPLSRKLFERTPREMTVYLGPWEIVGANPRRVVWQCSYAGEVLEHIRKCPVLPPSPETRATTSD